MPKNSPVCFPLKFQCLISFPPCPNASTISHSISVILSSHVLQEIETLCDRVILIHKGKIILDAQLNDLKKSKQQKIRVTFDKKIKNNSLEKLKYINNIIKISDFEYEILFDTKDDQRGKVFDFALDYDIKIISLYQKNESLEDTFRSLTEK